MERMGKSKRIDDRAWRISSRCFIGFQDKLGGTARHGTAQHDTLTTTIDHWKWQSCITPSTDSNHPTPMVIVLLETRVKIIRLWGKQVNITDILLFSFLRQAPSMETTTTAAATHRGFHPIPFEREKRIVCRVSTQHTHLIESINSRGVAGPTSARKQ